MKDLNSILEFSLNHIHEWGMPERYPMKRMFLTRAGGIPCSLLEFALLGASIVDLGAVSCKSLKHKTIKLLATNSTSQQEKEVSLQEAFLNVNKRIILLVSTIFFGIVFSPELNFRLHRSLQARHLVN